MDEFAFYNSQNEQKTEFIFSNTQQVYVPDQNSGSYPNGQVIFDLASLSNSGKYLDLQQSYITVPLVLNTNLFGSTTKSAENAFLASLKNGYHQLINSMSVEVTNCQVVNLTNFSNLDIHYRLVSGASREDELNFLPSIGFSKDNSESIIYRDISGATGCGECNNVVQQSLFTAANGWGQTGWTQNAGRLSRQLNTSFDPVNGSNGSLAASNQLCNENVMKTIGKNYVSFDGNTDVNHYILATIPLKIIHDIFKKIHLTKGMYMRLILNLNTQCQSVINIDTANSRYTGFSTTSLNNVFPCMISPIGATSGFVLNGTSKATVSLGIGKSYNTTTSFSHPTMTSCRFYAKLCEMTPQYEEMYLSAVPSKTILYNDILSFSTLNQPSNGSVSQLLTNGVSRPRYLIIVPQLAANINGSLKTSLASTFVANAGGYAATLGSPMNSPFSSSLGTTGFQAAISSLNILVSGQSVYQSNYMYGFEEFLHEVRGSNSINGGVPLGLSSGLLSQNDWENGYRFVYVDLSKRMSQSNDDISRSIQVSFTNSAAYAVDYFYILGYEKQITLSTSTGALII